MKNGHKTHFMVCFPWPISSNKAPPPKGLRTFPIRSPAKDQVFKHKKEPTVEDFYNPQHDGVSATVLSGFKKVVKCV